MLSRQEIEARIQATSAALDHLEGNGTLDDGFEIDRTFRLLREEYRRDPQAMSGLVEQLSALSRRFDEVLSARLPQIVDRFKEISERIRQAEEEKAAWREFLIRSAIRSRDERLPGTTGCVRVRAQEIRQMPAVGSDDRLRLEELIRAAGCWEQVSQISRPKLEKAMDANQIPPAQAADIERLCPITVMHQVSSQPV